MTRIIYIHVECQTQGNSVSISCPIQGNICICFCIDSAITFCLVFNNELFMLVMFVPLCDVFMLMFIHNFVMFHQNCCHIFGEMLSMDYCAIDKNIYHRMLDVCQQKCKKGQNPRFLKHNFRSCEILKAK